MSPSTNTQGFHVTPPAASSTGGNFCIPPFPPMRDRAPRGFLGTRTKIHAANLGHLPKFSPPVRIYAPLAG